MSDSIRDQLLKRGLVKPEDTHEARRARIEAERPPEPEKQLPPPFEAAPRGVIVDSRIPKIGRLA